MSAAHGDGGSSINGQADVCGGDEGNHSGSLIGDDMVAAAVVPHIEIVLSAVGEAGKRIGGAGGVVGGACAGCEAVRSPLNDKARDIG